ncbi:ABC transporter permease [Paraburkholderia sp. ZP32-5]|uniref:ABC transporter permease n=1 Tax=Paraburkholderia sp. ZP32-5 TaxID=2883245 RepID=UPI001F2E5F5A|nr:ABC transporter permease [Paraburkholderia sp. ZP32-5]
MPLKKETLIALLVLVGAWQLAATWLPPFLFPSVKLIGGHLGTIFTSENYLSSAIATSLRILGGMAGAFVIGGMLGLLMGRVNWMERYFYPLLTFNQGIPALSWVVFSIIWFKTNELRIWFIIVMTTLPAFAFQIHDSYRAMSKELVEMSLSFRPGKWDLFRTLVWPSVLPGIFTAWKVNLGNVSRVVVVAELVGATSGVGYQLLEQQQQFDMAGALAWTLVLVLFVTVSQKIVTLVEDFCLRYRPASERSV